MTTQEVVLRDEMAVASFGQGSTEGMALRLAEMRDQMALVKSFFGDVMSPNEDYGVIPGTKKPTLLKPGAEKLCELYGFTIVVRDLQIEKDVESGYYEATVTIALRRRGDDVVVAEGVGMATTYESRYRWRWLYEDKLPRGIDKSTLFSRPQGRATVYRMPNDDPHALWNTVLKMAKKRALVDATLAATRSSGLFTQDVEDLKDWADSNAPDGERGAEADDERARPTVVPVGAKYLGELLKRTGATVKDLEFVVEMDLPKDAVLLNLGTWLGEDDSRTLEGLIAAAVKLKERRQQVAEGMPCGDCEERRAVRYVGDRPMCQECISGSASVREVIEQDERAQQEAESAEAGQPAPIEDGDAVALGDKCSYPTCYGTSTRAVNGFAVCDDESHVLQPVGASN